MASYKIYQQQFAKDLINQVVNSSNLQITEIQIDNSNSSLKVLVDNFIDSLPYYFDPAMYSAHRGGLINLLESQLPNSTIAPEPMSSSWGVINTYSYNGNYSGYQNAFYKGIVLNDLATKMLTSITAINPALNKSWWGGYGVPVLTDAVHQNVSLSLNTNKLVSGLETMHSLFLPALSASYLTAFTFGFAPTVTAIQAITNTGKTEEAITVLKDAISEPSFIANINEGIAQGGQSSVAATWFLYNLWMALKSLNYNDVDSFINGLIIGGMEVPAEVQSKNWWNGGFVSWYVPLSGADVFPQASATITGSFPQELQVSAQGYPTYSYVNTPNGYSLSFCEWGELSLYKSSGSCFGKGTQVLLFDGSSKPIETIKVGEKIMTNLGARKVIMIESPKRANRPLYRINDLSFSVTSAHPFLSKTNNDARYAAIDPWALIDGIPTFIELGVHKIEKETLLSALKGGKPSEEMVRNIKTFDEEIKDENELVYDLLLENWEIDKPAYYVGGPDVFLAAQAEWIDPTFNYALSVVFITALKIAIPMSRKYINDPHRELDQIVGAINMNKIDKLSRKACIPYFGDKKFPEISLPEASFYMHNGEWDAHASILGYYLVRQYSRRIRSVLATNWRINNYSSKKGSYLTMGIFQLELINKPLSSNAAIGLELDLIGVLTSVDGETIKFDLESSEEPCWLKVIDETINLGKIIFEPTSYAVVVTLKSDGVALGMFKVTLLKGNQFMRFTNQIIYSKKGEAIGRIGVDVRKLSGLDIKRETLQKKQTTQETELFLAYCIGKQLGYKLSSLIEANTSIRS